MSAPAPQREDAVLYRARVMHRRRVAPLYRFVYGVFYVLLDIDRLAESARRHRLFSYNRFNLFSFYDRDHGVAPGALRAWVDATLAQRGLRLHGGRVRVLCMPRMFGYVFNPLSLFYCEDGDGVLRAVIAEVCNTFGERHCYVLDAQGRELAWETPQHVAKTFHVSPFFAVEGGYRFQLRAPGEGVRVAIGVYNADGPLLDTVLSGQRRPFSSRSIALSVARMPWATLKVVAAIHWQALKIWLRGARYHPKPEPPIQESH